MTAYKVLHPHESYRAIIGNKEAAKASFRQHVESDFMLCLRTEGLCDLPFAAVHNEMYKLGFSQQTAATRIQQFVSVALDLSPPANGESGDGLGLGGHRVEIKIGSSFTEKATYHIKRLRPFHDLTHYLLHLYDACRHWCWWAFIPAYDLYELCKRYDYFNGSTTGTKLVNAKNQNVERQFQIRPLASEETKSHRFWQELQAYAVDLNTLKQALLGPATETAAGPNKRMYASIESIVGGVSAA